MFFVFKLLTNNAECLSEFFQLALVFDPSTLLYNSVPNTRKHTMQSQNDVYNQGRSTSKTHTFKPLPSVSKDLREQKNHKRHKRNDKTHISIRPFHKTYRGVRKNTIP